jgi:hypothetical protein
VITGYSGYLTFVEHVGKISAGFCILADPALFETPLVALAKYFLYLLFSAD